MSREAFVDVDRHSRKHIQSILHRQSGINRKLIVSHRQERTAGFGADNGGQFMHANRQLGQKDDLVHGNLISQPGIREGKIRFELPHLLGRQFRFKLGKRQGVVRGTLCFLTSEFRRCDGSRGRVPEAARRPLPDVWPIEERFPPC